VTKVSNEELTKFSSHLEAAMKRIGAGRMALDSNTVRQLVREQPAAAARFVEIYCALGQSNPQYFQGAVIVATAYFVEFQDDSYVKMVREGAKESGAEDVVNRIGYMPTMPDSTTEPPERKAAKEWWKKSGRKDGLCDECAKPLSRGEGYQVRGPVYAIGSPSSSQKIDMGDEIICADCFRKTQGGKVWR
jgi:hypothetical protein